MWARCNLAVCAGNGNRKAVFVRQMQEKSREGYKKLYCAFVELEKTFD